MSLAGQGRALGAVGNFAFCVVALCLLALACRQGASGVFLMAGGAGWAAWGCQRTRESRSVTALSMSRRAASGLEDRLPFVTQTRPQGLCFADEPVERGGQSGQPTQGELDAPDAGNAQIEAQRRELAAQSAQIAEQSAQIAEQSETLAVLNAQLQDALTEARQAQEQESGWRAFALAAQSAQSQGEQERRGLAGRIGGMADALAAQVVTCLAEAEQAISTAIEAFTRIAEEAQEATSLAQQAVGVESENSVAGIASRATDVMGLFIEGMLMSARRIAQSARRLERLSDVSQRLCGLANDVENVADQTALVALNASIEAARAGHAGRTFTVVAKEVSKLAHTSRGMAERMRGLTGELSRETITLHTDLSLMAESSLEESCTAQAEVNRLLDLLRHTDTLTQESLSQLAARSQNITANYASIVMAFQFHDLLRQRLEHVAQPLAELSAQLQGGDSVEAGEETLRYAVGRNEFQARAIGIAPALEVVTYTPEQDDNVTLF